MVKEKFIVNSTDKEKDLFNDLDKSSSDANEKDLKTDVFCLFYNQNPVLKEIEELPTKLWVNYFFVEGLYTHYSFKNLQAFTKDHSVDAYWIADKIISELQLIKDNKKIMEFLNKSYNFLSTYKDEDYEDLISDKNTFGIRKQIKIIISKIMISINEFFKKIELIKDITRGHDIAPLSLQQFDENKIIQLTEKLQNHKIKDLVIAFLRSNIKESSESTQNTKKDENPEEILTHNIFYVNDSTAEQKEIYKKWLVKEIKGHNKDRCYKNQITAYVKAGNLMSKADEIESLSFALNLFEISRLQKRNYNVIVSKESLGDKTYMFKNNNEVEIFESNQSFKMPIIEGIVDFLTELLSGITPPKPKFSLNLNLSSKAGPGKKKKVFKKPTSFIKFT